MIPLRLSLVTSALASSGLASCSERATTFVTPSTPGAAITSTSGATKFEARSGERRAAPPSPSPLRTRAPEAEPRPSLSDNDEASDRARWTELLASTPVDRLDGAYRIHVRDSPLLDLVARDRPAAIAFFATYCPPCIEEMTMLGELHAEGWSIAGVSLDAGRAERVQEVLAKRKVRYPVGIVRHDTAKAIGRALDQGLPFTVVVDARSEARALFRGETDRDTLLGALRSAGGPSPH